MGNEDALNVADLTAHTLELLLNLGKRARQTGINERQAIRSFDDVDASEAQTLYARDAIENMIHTFLLHLKNWVRRTRSLSFVFPASTINNDERTCSNAVAFDEFLFIEEGYCARGKSTGAKSLL